VAEFDAFKQGALPLKGDAKIVIEGLMDHLEGYSINDEYRKEASHYNRDWDEKVNYAYTPDTKELPSQSEVIGAVNEFSNGHDVLVCAAGSLPGDLHKLWRTRDPKGFHLEYGYSCMGYEIAGGIGVKMAAPEREVFVMVGDGGYLMMPAEIITSLQEHRKLIIILINNNGFASIGGLSNSIGSKGFGTSYRYRDGESGQLDGESLPVDLATNAESLGAKVFRAKDIPSFNQALKEAKKEEKTSLIYIETLTERKIQGYGWAWWDVPVAEISKSESVKNARKEYENMKNNQRYFL